MVYAVLSRGSQTGAELIDEIERLTRGWWRPSPGSIYPLLDQMAQDGVIRKREDGRFELVPSQRGFEGWPFGRPSPRNAEEAVQELGGLVSYLEDLGSTRKEELASAKERLREVATRLGRLIA